MTDFPAGHSMDTEWFAVDRDGHVAHFSSGEAGAVPGDGDLGEDWGPVFEGIERGLPKRASSLDAEGPFAPELGAPRHLARAGDPRFPVLAFLESLDPARAELDAGSAREEAASAGKAVIFTALSEERFGALHASGACRGCRVAPTPEDGAERTAPFGLYSYAHLPENWIAGPYGRERVPAEPVRLGQLPPQVREVVGKVRFEHLCFAESPRINPPEHLPRCQAWDGAWLDPAQKTVRPLAGQEELFAQNYAEGGDLRGALEGEYAVEAIAPEVAEAARASAEKAAARVPQRLRPAWIFALGVLAAALAVVLQRACQ